MNYLQQPHWKNIQSFLPENLHFSADYSPTEEWWDWQGHRIHLDCFRDPDAPAKLILFHGVGTNGRQMSMITGGPMARKNLECIAIDMPTYGVTEVDRNQLVSYDDWVQAAVDLVTLEAQKDDRPIFLYGLSAGGMLAYQVACKTPLVKGIIGMTFLDLQHPTVRRAAMLHPVMATVGVPIMHLAAKIPGLRAMKIPMALAGKMHALVNNPDGQKACSKDPSSAGNWASIKFLDSFMNYKADIKPEHFDRCPILLTQPAADRWTPLALSEVFLNRIKKVPVTVTMLKDAGHYPMEQAGLEQMHQAIEHFIYENLETRLAA